MHDEILDGLVQNEAVLILGPPGSGKTVFSYEAAHALRARGRIPIVVDVGSEMTETATLAKVVRELTGDQSASGSAEVVFLIDGVDEQLASGVPASGIAARLAALARLTGTLVTCREREYETQLAAVLPSDLFSRICRLESWRVEDEIRDFLERLVAAGLLHNMSLLTAIRDDHRLRQLASRPLHARMLTYVAQDGRLPASAVELYEQYLGKLSSRTRQDLVHSGCELEDVAALWAKAAWSTSAGVGRADALPLDVLLGTLRTETLSTGCIWRALNAVIDVESDHLARAAFVHYSFYEHLVAYYVAQGLIAARSADNARRAAELLAHDLTREIRQHLTGLLRRSLLDRYSWPSWLVAMYAAAPTAAVPRRIARNLIAYITCRLDVPFVADLQPLLEAESDPFLRNSLMWALVRGDDRETLRRYTEELHADGDLAAMNRGYVLYYYGDLETGDPPYVDDSPWSSWAHTRAKLLERFADAPAYGNTPPSRRVIDLYTFCDYARVRSERLNEDETEIVDGLVSALPDDLPTDAIERLQARVHAARAQ